MSLAARRFVTLIGILVSGFSLCPGTEVDSIDALVAAHLERYPALPSLAAVVVTDGEFAAAGVAGVRKRGEDVPVTMGDKYHIGSCTKAVTATLAARLVEEGVLKWESTLGEILGKMNPDARAGKATLLELVSNTGGFPKEVPDDVWDAAWRAAGDPRTQRQAFARKMIRRATESPGTRYEYSNTGFAIAGVMMEEATDTSWEELVEQKIFVPLGMASAGFYGPARDPKTPDQPWGHTEGGKPVPPGRGSDNPAAIAPAGAIHSSLPDLVPWLTLHLKRTTGSILREESSFDLLHSVQKENYALGWVVIPRKWAGGNALHHTGSNTMFTTVIWIAPERGFAVAVATNIGQKAGFGPCDELIGTLIQKYLPR